MGIFSKTSKELEAEVKNLKSTISHLNSIVADLQEENAECDIEIQRVRTSLNREIESLRGLNADQKASYDRSLTSINNDFEDRVYEKECELEQNSRKEIAAEKKNLKAEFGDKIKTLESKVKDLEISKAKTEGLYSGTLLVIKALEEQLKQSNKTNESLQAALTKALPDVSVKTGNAEQNVTVNG